MNKDKGPFLKIFIAAAIPIAASLFIYVLVTQEIKSLNKEKINKEELLLEKINKVNQKMVAVQQLSSEARITTIAKESLGLIRKGEEFDKIRIDKYKADQIEKIVNEKYE
ncbi:MAG: hypothetical protein KJ571_17440 [Bacteroidetes bacterium]|nr:hypothetical protein [Bacteroidota bacterium]